MEANNEQIQTEYENEDLQQQSDVELYEEGISFLNEETISIDLQLKQIIESKIQTQMEMSELRNEMNCLNNERTELMEKYNDDYYLYECLLDQLRKDEEIIVTLNQSLSEIEQQFTDLMETFIKLKNASDQLFKADFKLEVHKVTDKIEEIEIAEKTNQKILLELEGAYKQNLTNLNKLEIIAQTPNEDVDFTEYDLEIAKIKEEILKTETEDKELDSEIANCECRSIEIDKQILENQADIEKQHEILNSLTTNESDLVIETLTSVKVLENIDMNSIHLNEQKDQATSKLNSLEQKLHELIEQNVLSNNQVESQQNILQENNAKFLEMKAKHAEIKANVESLQNELRCIFSNNSLYEMTKSMKEQSQNLTYLESVLQDKENQINSLKDQQIVLENEQIQLSKLIDDIHKEIENEIEANKLEYEKRNEELLLLSNKKKILSEKEEKKKYLIISNQYLEEKLEHIEPALLESQSKYQKLIEEKQNAENLLRAKQETIKKLQKELDAIQLPKPRDVVKSLLKSPGKAKPPERCVSFIETPSFRSITESESSQTDSSRVLDLILSNIELKK